MQSKIAGRPRGFISAPERRAKDSSTPRGMGAFGLTLAVLNILVGIAQVGVFAVAWVSYKRTVVPIYQKELLDEQIAAKTKELNEKSSQLAYLQSNVTMLADKS